MKNKMINSDLAPAAIGPYSHAVLATNGTLYISGQLPIDPNTGNFAGDDIVSQTEQALQNVLVILQEANMTKENVCKTTVYLKDMNDFTKMNEVYANFFGDVKPARAAFEVGKLPKDAKVEVEVVAC
ncbi:RidA family protein [Spiroplasma chrysopicola]|uniref:TdcF protein n=1 Tax=Spiroplasma chrysopicola DF-1 TaxID=1276227 RepID=R4UIH7_9MOLU|nr:RidA family protein [Spiroplasma chrysopicola]AGM25116.1 TdcF protein [Spiroplasma chrysopicola DF-1]